MSDNNKNIILVENNVQVTKVIEKLLGKIYEISSYDNAEDALKEIKRSAKSPPIVITGNILKKMNGDEFLLEVEKYDSEIIRLILTSSDDSRELITLLQKSHAHFYIKKPFNGLELMQIIKNMHYMYQKTIESKYYNKKIQKIKIETEEYKSKFKELAGEKAENFQSIIKSISKMIYGAERFYFKPHTKNLSQVAKKLAMRLELKEADQLDIVYASIISNHYLIGLPDKYRLLDPRDISNEDTLSKFIKHFKESIANLQQIKSISKHVKLVSMIFENIDGTGKPNGITGIELPKTMQIIGLVNLYFNLVYRLREEDLFKLKLEGVIYQSKKLTYERHQEAITYLYKRIKWFDHDLFYKFQEMLKKRDVTELKFNEKDLKIEYKSEEYIIPLKSDGRMDEYVSAKTFSERKQVRVVNQELKLIEEFIEMKLRIEQLEAGMELSREITNYSGESILKAGTKLSEEQVSKINKYFENETIPDVAFIKKQQND